MQGAGDPLLADARFAGNQNRGIAAGQARQHAGDLTNGRRSTEDAFDQALARGNDAVDTVDQCIKVKRLGNEIMRALLEQIDRRIDIAVPGNENEGWNAEVLGQQLHEQLITAQVGQRDVADHQRIILVMQGSPGLGGGLVPVAGESFQLEAIDQRLPHNFIVFNETQARISSLQFRTPEAGRQRIGSGHPGFRHGSRHPTA